MNRIVKQTLVASVVAACAVPVMAYAQDAAPNALMQLDVSSLRGEIQNRYNAALAATNDQSVVMANDNRFMWASQAKAQCGIALGFLKSSTKDAVSIGKCDDAYNRMKVLPPPPPVPVPAPAPAPLPPACGQDIAGIIFFEFDSDVPPDSAAQTIDNVVHLAQTCNWSKLIVTGHTDRSGSDAYNDKLSVRRAQAVAQLLGAKGVAQSVLEVSGKGESEPKVPTPDGVRSPENRRVEIMVK